MNSERFTLRHIKIKLLKDKEKMVKAVQQSDSIYKSSFEVRKNSGLVYSKCSKKNTVNQEPSNWQNNLSNMREKL